MPFFFLRKSRFLKNKRLLLFYANEYIDKLEKGSGHISCKQDLMKKISSHIDEYESDFATYTERNNDYITAAKSMVFTDSIELIESGKYHLHGVFNSSGPGGSLVNVYKLASKDAFDSGLISKEEYEENLLVLKEAVTRRY